MHPGPGRGVQNRDALDHIQLLQAALCVVRLFQLVAKFLRNAT